MFLVITMTKYFILMLLLVTLKGEADTGLVTRVSPRRVSGTCEVVKQVSVDSYLFLCRLYYAGSVTNIPVRIQLPPKLRTNIGTFTPSRHSTSPAYTTVYTQITNTVDKLVVVKGIPWADSQYYIETIGFPTPYGTRNSYSRQGRRYKGVFVIIEDAYAFEGNNFPLVELQK